VGNLQVATAAIAWESSDGRMLLHFASQKGKRIGWLAGSLSDDLDSIFHSFASICLCNATYTLCVLDLAAKGMQHPDFPSDVYRIGRAE
jgi:hypothetical protein